MTICTVCGEKISDKSKSGRCRVCAGAVRRKKERPLPETLAQDIWKLGYVETAKKHGVNTRTIKNWEAYYVKQRDSKRKVIM